MLNGEIVIFKRYLILFKNDISYSVFDSMIWFLRFRKDKFKSLSVVNLKYLKINQLYFYSKLDIKKVKLKEKIVIKR